jgi:alpha-amylase/alpha-mannosidase (GH57 family)
MSRFVCVHGHFYQPPRENPWTGRVEAEASAAPFHDWNERITSECYAPNADAGNYSRMSFNFGPTLLSWLEREAGSVYGAILAADRESRERFSGHGSALAQAHSHVILPLASARDKRTQVRWGVLDFERRFGRSPEGMWLPETAVDLETLDALVEQGILFTILAPHQARAWRKIGDREWQEVLTAGPDPRRPYAVPLPSGRRIAVFLYDGPASNSIAFGGLALGGEFLARRLAGLLEGAPEGALAHVATDGETYGHHFRGGERVLAEAFRFLEVPALPSLTNYGEYLAAHPPAFEVELTENTSWSCVHGVGRWRENCGCGTGEHPGWSQNWRAPLRRALDWLRDELAGRFEHAGRRIFRDPWRARDKALPALDGGSADRERFLGEYGLGPLDEEARREALRLLRMQWYSMLMFASCGWFFDDPAGLETRQILRFAARAIELAEPAEGDPLEQGFLSLLADVRSNDPEAGDGRQIYETSVRIGGLKDWRIERLKGFNIED